MDSVWRLVHLIAAAYWLGGLIMLAVVAVVAGRSLEPPAFRALMARTGRAFAVGALLAGAAIALSGVAMAASRLHGWNDLRTTAWGHTLVAKTILAALLVVLAAVHSYAGSRTSSRRWVTASRILSPVLVLVTLAVFYLAVTLTETET